MKANIYKLSSMPFQKAFPLLLSTVINKGHKVLVLCEGANDMQCKDNMLWSCSSLLFIPHGTVNDQFAEMQPIYLTSDYLSNNNNADVIFTNLTSVNLHITKYTILLSIFSAITEDHLCDDMLEMLNKNTIPTTIFLENNGIWKSSS